MLTVRKSPVKVVSERTLVSCLPCHCGPHCRFNAMHDRLDLSNGGRILQAYQGPQVHANEYLCTLRHSPAVFGCHVSKARGSKATSSLDGSGRFFLGSLVRARLKAVPSSAAGPGKRLSGLRWTPPYPSTFMFMPIYLCKATWAVLPKTKAGPAASRRGSVPSVRQSNGSSRPTNHLACCPAIHAGS
jgi:hypothetical protein